MPPLDEAKMEKAMAMLAGEAEKINEDDPRQAAQLMRKLTDATGLSLGAGMEEALTAWKKGRIRTGSRRRWAIFWKGKNRSSSREGKGKGAGSRNPAWTKPSTTCSPPRST